MIFDITVGSVKYGSDLNTSSYFLSGGYQLPCQNQIYAFGFGKPMNKGLTNSSSNQGAPKNDITVSGLQ